MGKSGTLDVDCTCGKMLTSCYCLLLLAGCVLTKFTSDVIGSEPSHVLLTCSTEELSHDTDIISIVIFNRTTSHIVAWVTAKDGDPKFGNGSAVSNRFISGFLRKDDVANSKLQILFLYYQAASKANMGCKIKIMKHMAEIEEIDLTTDITVPNEMGLPASTTSPKATTKDSRQSGLGENVAWQNTLRFPHSTPTESTDTPLRTGSVIHPTVLDQGVPLYVFIIVMVVLSIFIIITTILSLLKLRGRCGNHQPYPSSHYGISGNTFDTSWDSDKAIKSNRPSIHSMSRSHYCLPRPPPPPTSQLIRCKSSREYALGGRYPGMVRTHYMAPYDAIAQDSSEDGDRSLLNISQHDLTPSLPPEQAGEATYKVPRNDGSLHSQQRGSNMYTPVPSLSALPLDC